VNAFIRAYAKKLNYKDDEPYKARYSDYKVMNTFISPRAENIKYIIKITIQKLEISHMPTHRQLKSLRINSLINANSLVTDRFRGLSLPEESFSASTEVFK
jgi:hypothetical protein